MIYTPLYPSFWSDPDVVELETSHKLLFLYLMSNFNVTLSGIYPMSTAVAARETGVTRVMVESFFKSFRNVHYESEERMIFVVKRLGHIKSGNPNWIKKGVETEYLNSKDSKLWKLFFDAYPSYRWIAGKPKKPPHPAVRNGQESTGESPKKLSPPPPDPPGTFVDVAKPGGGLKAVNPAKPEPKPKPVPPPPPPPPDPAVIQGEWTLVASAYNKITGTKTGMVDVIKISRICNIEKPSIIAYGLARLHLRMRHSDLKKIVNPISFTANIIEKRMACPSLAEGGDDMAFKEHLEAADWLVRAGVIVSNPNPMPKLSDILKGKI